MLKNAFAVFLIAVAAIAATDCFPGLLHELAEVCRFDAVRRIVG